MDRLPAARVVPREHLARWRAVATHASRAVGRTWARIARQALILALTAIGFAGILAMTFVLAQHAITVHACPAAHDRPMVIYFMKAPPQHPVRAAITTLGAAQGELDLTAP
jgi:hypothetical protein